MSLSSLQLKRIIYLSAAPAQINILFCCTIAPMGKTTAGTSTGYLSLPYNSQGAEGMQIGFFVLQMTFRGSSMSKIAAEMEYPRSIFCESPQALQMLIIQRLERVFFQLFLFLGVLLFSLGLKELYLLRVQMKRVFSVFLLKSESQKLVRDLLVLSIVWLFLNQLLRRSSVAIARRR